MAKENTNIPRHTQAEKSREDSVPPEKRKWNVARRSFLQILGYTAASATVAGCQKPVEKAIPYLIKPEEITPGTASWYASTCEGCKASCGILVKTREGRPIKLEGNNLDVRTNGGLCAAGQAAIWSLYDSERLRGPSIQGKEVDWDEVDNRIRSGLTKLAESGKQIYLLSGTVTSPALKRAVRMFKESFPTARHVVYDAISQMAIVEAYRLSHGTAIFPAYRFDRAQYIVSFDADFLGTWISPVEFTRQYVMNRKPDSGYSGMSCHVQFESRMSLTGSNADLRVQITPSEHLQCLLWLAQRISEMVGDAGQNEGIRNLFSRDFYLSISGQLRSTLNQVAQELWKNRGKCLIVSGVNDIDLQLLIIYLNSLLGNYGTSIDLDHPSYQEQGADSPMVNLVKSMNEGEVGTLIIWGTNPAYSFPDAKSFIEGLRRIELKVSFNNWHDETTDLMDYWCPNHHFLESWGDAEIVQGFYTLRQPTIHPLYNTRHTAESLLKWCGQDIEMYDFLQDTWKKEIYPSQNKFTNFQSFWDIMVHDGICQIPTKSNISMSGLSSHMKRIVEAYHKQVNHPSPFDGNNFQFEIDLYESVAIRDGSLANNPWLQELPDSLTKVTWENVALFAPATARKLNLQEGNVVRISNESGFTEIPVVVQNGQHERVVSVALGYGRKRAGKAGSDVGVNAYPFVSYRDGTFRYSGALVRIEPIGKQVILAKTQTHDYTEGRSIVHELTPQELDDKDDTHIHREHERKTLWEAHEHKEHRWVMAIDLNSCTGCGACVIACQAENNIPVVGKDEVRNRREMHWIRIDRYYAGSEDDPRILFQPLMCQQCDHAPCETVCPVLATVHSSDGLNMQIYNRCIGTRYCANNCPFKVRRFNWFNYKRDNLVENLVLNPDVVVRSRGVMEKCSFCIQRIQEMKIRARNERRQIIDGEIRTACQQSCPANAIMFGDLNDPKSQVAQLLLNKRAYRLLTELNVEPSVWYLSKVRNLS